MNTMPPSLKRFWSKVAITADDEQCWLWLAGCFHSGYGSFGFNGKVQRAHRVSWQLTYGEIPETLQVLHTCDNPLCVNPHHLFLGTDQINSDDKLSKGRQVRGQKHARSKIANKDVAQVRKLYSEGGISQYKLASKFGITQSQVSLIINMKSRKFG